MEQRPCLIIGASGDIGQAIARKLHEQGRPLAVTHSPRSGPVAGLEDVEGKLKWYAVDVCDSASVNALVAAVTKDFKAPPDLVYAAGVTRDSSISLMTDEAWDAVIKTNISGAFYATRALARPLMMTGNGRIIYLGSITAIKGNAGQYNYAATKAALEAMCRVAALEFGRFGITCNVVAPGAIESRMLSQIPAAALEVFKKAAPLRRLGQTDEVAGLVSYLLSDEARFITGQTIYLDGGVTAG